MFGFGARPSKTLLVIAVAAVGVLSACGGGSSDSSSETTSTQAAAAGVLDASAQDGAKAAGLTQTDLGEGWAEYQKAGGFLAATEEDCITEFGSGITDTDEFYSGPMFRGAGDTAYIYTRAYVFKTEAQAKAFTAARNTEDFTNCKEASDDAAQKKRDANTYVRVTKTTDPGVGSNGLEAYYVEEPGTTNADGTESANGSYSRYTYRSGRVVYVILVDVGQAPDAASVDSLGAQVNTAVASVKDAIDSRLQALDL